MLNLTDKEFIELRLKCLEPFITIASKHSIEHNLVIDRAEEAWKYAIQPLMNKSSETTDKKSTSTKKS